MGRDATIFIGMARLDLFVPDARSLKEKRSHTRGLVQRLKNRHTVLVSEYDHQDLHQRAAIAVCAMSTDITDLEARLQRVRSTVDETWTGHVLEWDVEVIQAE